MLIDLNLFLLIFHVRKYQQNVSYNFYVENGFKLYTHAFIPCNITRLGVIHQRRPGKN